jgi:hypothetical protein
MINMQKNPFKIISAFVFLGFLATMGLLILRFVAPEASQFHLPSSESIQLIMPSTLTRAQADQNIWSIIVDNFFIAGYTGIFFGAYLYIKDAGYYAKFALIFGLVTTVTDIIENGMVVAISNSMVIGYQPESLLWGIFWTISSIKDISAYIATFSFAVLFLVTLYDKPTIRTNKIVFAVIFLLFSFIGSLGLFSPAFLNLRNLLFVIDLVIATIVFYRTDPVILETL